MSHVYENGFKSITPSTTLIRLVVPDFSGKERKKKLADSPDEATIRDNTSAFRYKCVAKIHGAVQDAGIATGQTTVFKGIREMKITRRPQVLNVLCEA